MSYIFEFLLIIPLSFPIYFPQNKKIKVNSVLNFYANFCFSCADRQSLNCGLGIVDNCREYTVKCVYLVLVLADNFWSRY